MFVFLFHVILLQLSFFAPSASVQANTDVQIDRHIQNLVDVRNPDVNYWFLAQLAVTREEFATAIITRINQIRNQSRLTDTTLCYFEAMLGQTTGQPLHERLVAGYACEGSVDLKIAAFYEAPGNLRTQVHHIIGELPADETPSSYALFSKALGLDYQRSALFEIRRFRLRDFYILHSLSSPGDEYKSLVAIWDAEIRNKSRLTDPLDFLMLQTLIGFRHTIEFDYATNYGYLRWIQGSQNYTNLVSKQTTLKRLAFAAYIQGYYQTTLNFYRENLLPLTRTIRDTEEVLRVELDYGNILFRLGDMAGALQTYRRVHENIDLIEDERYVSALLNNLAVSYLNTGYFEQYVSLQLQAYEQASGIQAYTSQLRILNNLYIYHLRNSDWTSAIMYLENALSIAQAQRLDNELVEIYTLFGTYYRDREQNYKKAIEFLELALSQINRETSYRIYTTTTFELATTLRMMGELDRSVAMKLNLLDEARNRGDQWSELETLVTLANHFLDVKDIEEASVYLRQIEVLPDTDLDLRLRNYLTNARVKYNLANGESLRAIREVQNHASELISYIRSSADLQSGNIRLEPGFQESFTLLIDALYDQNLHAEAAGWLDEIKNLNKAAIVNSNLIRSAVLTEEEFLADIQLSNRIDFLREEQSRANAENILRINTELLQLLDEKNRINNKVLQSYTTRRLDITQAQRELSRGEQILAYTLIGNTLYVTIITRSVVRLHKIPFNQDIIELAENVSTGLRANRTNLHALRALYEQTVMPFLVDGVRRLTVIPDGFFYDIPLDIMPVHHNGGPFSYGSARYLIEDMSIAYQSSVADLVFQRRNPKRRQYDLEYLGIGISDFSNSGSLPSLQRTLSQLPYAAVEINTAYDIFSTNGPSRKLLNRESTKHNFMQLAGSSRILHIATHSEVYARDPLFSMIHLYRDDDNMNDHGLIYAYELFNMSLDSEIIVMSSCESGSGNYRRGSGIIGLGRALTFAGASSLILNLWSIRDQTAFLITTSFYENLQLGKPKDVALRQAKLTYINEVNSDPAVWGTLILFGDHKEINPDWSGIWVYVILGIIGISLVLIYRRRSK